MLRARIISAAVLVPLVLIMLAVGPLTTALGTGIAAVIAANEFYTMAVRSPYRFQVASIPGYLAAAAFSLAGYLHNLLLMGLIALALVVVTGPLVWFTRRPVSASSGDGVLTAGSGSSPLSSWGLSVFASLYVGLPLGLIALIRSDANSSRAIWWVVLICLGTWGADTGGYIFGRWFGRHKLAPKISPKKTVEGALGGILLATIGVSLVGYLALDIPLYWTVPLGVVLAVVSILGDLFESWVKRRFDTKDSGKLIPGHGGLLDRIDSFLAVTVVAYLFMLLYF